MSWYPICPSHLIPGRVARFAFSRPIMTNLVFFLNSWPRHFWEFISWLFSSLGLFSVWPFLQKVYLAKSKIWPLFKTEFGLFQLHAPDNPDPRYPQTWKCNTTSACSAWKHEGTEIKGGRCQVGEKKIPGKNYRWRMRSGHAQKKGMSYRRGFFGLHMFVNLLYLIVLSVSLWKLFQTMQCRNNNFNRKCKCTPIL